VRTSNRSSHSVADERVAARDRTALRAVCLLAAGGVVFFTAYVSFVPFRIDPAVTFQDALHALSRRSAWRLGSRSNFLGNIVLYLPVGFFAAGAVFGGGSSWARRLLLTPLVLAFSIASSAAIESLQAFLPSRVPSVSDVAAQLAGAFVGLVTWFLVDDEVYAWWRRRRTGDAGHVRHLWFALYLGVYAVAALLPLDVTLDAGRLARKWRAGGVILNPLHSPSWSAAMILNLIGDVIIALPIGLLASIAGVRAGARRSALAALAICTLALGAIEAAQLIVISRTADSADFLVALAGAALGVGLASGLVTRHADEPRARVNWRAAGLVAAVLVYAAYNWAPFNPVFSFQVIRARVAAFWQPPFYGYYLHPELTAAADLLIRTAISAPMGLCWTLWTAGRSADFRRTLAVVGLVLVSLFATVVELGQLLLPSRYPDSTDVLIAIGGFAIGVAIARGLVRRAKVARSSRGWAGALDPGK
jgi:VanZ family protein